MPVYRFAYDWVKPLYLGARLASSTKILPLSWYSNLLGFCQKSRGSRARLLYWRRKLARQSLVVRLGVRVYPCVRRPLEESPGSIEQGAG